MDCYDFFCMKYLNGLLCERGDACIFHHKPLLEVRLIDEISNGLDFVQGCLINSTSQDQDRIVSRICLSDLPCYYTSKHLTCMLGKHCFFSHKIVATNPMENVDNESVNYGITVSKELPKLSQCGSSTSNQEVNNDCEDHYLRSTGVIKKQFGQKYKYPKKSMSQRSTLNANANEFVPSNNQEVYSALFHTSKFNSDMQKPLCPYAELYGFCKQLSGECTYLHGDICDLCTRPALHPYDENQRKNHITTCIKRHERAMEQSFSVARSKDKVCGICFEVVMQKNKQKQRFGLLPNCNHCFCLECIRKWRESKQFSNNIIRSCPECRTASDFVCPSPYWVDTKDDKQKVIDNYKGALAKKDCKYFKKGKGKCAFGNKCFYRHCLENGEKVDVGPPSKNIIQRLTLLNMLEDEFDDLEAIFAAFNSDDDSDYVDDDSSENEYHEFRLFYEIDSD